ncbi:hypothetical protein X772_32190 [Mesorhizobium sp. LSJC280B00]|nr:hypothetical protein X772_32190 [Mesorhizobium sp. LSJC280B00]
MLRLRQDPIDRAFLDYFAEIENDDTIGNLSHDSEVGKPEHLSLIGGSE